MVSQFASFVEDVVLSGSRGMIGSRRYHKAGCLAILSAIPTRGLVMYRLILLVVVLLSMTALAGAADRPNILWLIAEDFGPELGCYGYPGVKTPHLDSLADEGMRFQNAFTVTPVCSTSRSSFMTGMHALTIGAHNHRSHRGTPHPLPPGVKLLPHRLRDAGYFTANVRRFPDGVDFTGTGKTDWNFSYEGKAFQSDRWEDLKSHQPFYAQVNFPETHRGGAWDHAHESITETADPETVVIPPYYPDHDISRQVWAQYLNTAMALDRKIGVILERLKRDGLLEKTIVVFLGDHGRAMPRGKQWPYDSGLHIPLLIRWPESISAPREFERGGVDQRLIASIDLTATTLAWAGVRKPGTMQGRVFWGAQRELDRQYVFAGRDRGDETVDRIRTVRDKRYRYIRNFYPERPFTQLNRYKEASYPILRLLHRLHDAGQLAGPPSRLMAPARPREELYDLHADPHEVHNLAESPEHHETLLRLRTTLDEWLVSADDQGRFPEPPEVIEQFEVQMRRSYDVKLEKLRAAESGSGL